MPEPQGMNEAETRTPQGEIKDQGTPPPNPDASKPITTPSPETKTPETPQPDPAKKPDEKETLLSKKDEKPAGAPEKYEAFKVPEGVTLEGESLTKAQELFKGLGLSQEAAQSLVDFHAAQLVAAAKAPEQAYEAMRNEWKTASEADPDIGPKSKQIRENLGRAFDTLGDPKLVSDFKSAMNLTGVGDHPAFIKVMNKWASALIEPKHVAGGGPTPDSQKGPNAKPPSVAQSMYPNLPSSNQA